MLPNDNYTSDDALEEGFDLHSGKGTFVKAISMPERHDAHESKY